MPRIYTKKTDREYQSRKVQALPEKFQRGFLAALDGRTDLAKALRQNYDEIVKDLGGADDLSHVKSSLIERRFQTFGNAILGRPSGELNLVGSSVLSSRKSSLLGGC